MKSFVQFKKFILYYSAVKPPTILRRVSKKDDTNITYNVYKKMLLSESGFKNRINNKNISTSPLMLLNLYCTWSLTAEFGKWIRSKKKIWDADKDERNSDDDNIV